MELENLEFRISATAGDTAKAIDALADSLARLREATKGGIQGLSLVARQLKNLNGAVNDKSAKNITNLAKALAELGKSTPTIPEDLPLMIRLTNRAAYDISDESIRKLRELAEALKGLKGLGNIKMPKINPQDVNGGAKKGKEEDVNPPTDADADKPRGRTSEDSGAKRSAEEFDLAKAAGERFRWVLGKIKSTLITVGHAAKHVGLEIGKGLGSLASAALPRLFGSNLLGAVKSVTSALGKLFASMKRIALYRLMRSAIKLFTEGLNEGLKNLYAYSQGIGSSFSSALDSIASSALYVKNSFAAMASPLIEALSPAIDYIADKVVALFNLINQLIARLTGKSTYTAAKKISTTWQAAATDAGNGAASAAKKASEELKKTILGFDEINALTKPTTSGSSGGSGGSSGSGSGIDTSGMFEEVAIDNDIANFVDHIKDLFSQGKWDEIGGIIADGINSAFAKVDELINWDNVGPTVTKYVDGFCGIFNSMVDKVDWDLIGKTFGDGINTIVETADRLYNGIDWENLGEKISDGIDSFIATVDFNRLGDTIGDGVGAKLELLSSAIINFNWIQLGTKMSEGIDGFVISISETLDGINWGNTSRNIAAGITNLFTGINWDELGMTVSNAILDTLTALGDVVEKVDWRDIGAKINSGLEKIDWKGIASALAELVGATLGGIGAIIWECFKDEWDKIIDHFDQSIKDCGGDVIKGIMLGIIDGLVGIGQWCYDNILTPFISGFKQAFSIHSPASEPGLLEAAGNVGLGILKGIAAPFLGIADWVNEHILTPIKNAIGGDVPTLNVDVPETVTMTVTAVKDKAWDTVMSAWNAVKNSTAVKTISGVTHKAFTTVKNAFTALKNATAWKVIAGKTHKKFTDVKNAFNGLKGNTITKTITGATKKAFNTVKKAFNAFKGNTITKTVTGKITGAFYSAKNAFKGLKNHKITLTASGIISSTVKTIKKIWDGLKSKTITIRASMKAIWSGVSSTVRRLLGLHTGGIYKNGGWKPIQSYASGGYPFGGQIFRARENGNPELVGTLNGSTAVMNNTQIVASVSEGVRKSIAGIHFSLKGLPTYESVNASSYYNNTSSSMSYGNSEEMINEARRQNTLLTRQNELLQRLLEKETTVEVTTKQFQAAASRQNRRDGRTTIAVSAV